MTRIAADAERRRVVGAPREEVWEVLADLERHGELMPRVRSFEEVDGGWRWVMEGERRFGQRIQPRFTVRYALHPPDRIAFAKAERPGDSAEADGAIVLADADGGTEVSFAITISVDVAIPSVLRGPAGSMLAGEIDALIDGFLTNLTTAVEA